MHSGDSMVTDDCISPRDLVFPQNDYQEGQSLVFLGAAEMSPAVYEDRNHWCESLKCQYRNNIKNRLLLKQL